MRRARPDLPDPSDLPVVPVLPVVLVTGFEPFGGDRFNPSAAIAARLDGCRVAAPAGGGDRAIVRAAELPCVFGGAIEALLAAMRRHRPAVVIALGLAASRTDISVERVAINVDDARIPDNAGNQPIDRPIRGRGPAAYWSTLPVKAVVAAISAAGLPASLSQSAGTFVCNHVFYGLAHRIATMRGARPRGGFIHVPMPADAGGAMTLEAMVEAIRIAAAVAVTHAGADLAAVGGALD